MSSLKFYILNDAHEPCSVSFAEWAVWFDDGERRRVALDQVGDL